MSMYLGKANIQMSMYSSGKSQYTNEHVLIGKSQYTNEHVRVHVLIGTGLVHFEYRACISRYSKAEH